MKVSRHHSTDFMSGFFRNSVPRPTLESSTRGRAPQKLKTDMMKDARANFFYLIHVELGLAEPNCN